MIWIKARRQIVDATRLRQRGCNSPAGIDQRAVPPRRFPPLSFPADPTGEIETPLQSRLPKRSVPGTCPIAGVAEAWSRLLQVPGWSAGHGWQADEWIIAH